MPGPPRKPCFQAPVARLSQEKPVERGQSGWLEAMVVDIDKEKPKAGEPGWLVSMAEDLAREEEFAASGDTTVLSGELSSRRSSQGTSQGSPGKSTASCSSGDGNGTLRPLSGSLPSQASSQRLSQSQDQKSSQSQESSQPSSQPSSMDILSSQAVSSQLLALAAENSQANQSAQQDVLVTSSEEGGVGCVEHDEADVGVTPDAISQDFFSPEQSQVEGPTAAEIIASPSFDMFNPSEEAPNVAVGRGLAESDHVDASTVMDSEEASVDRRKSRSEFAAETPGCFESDDCGHSGPDKRTQVDEAEGSDTPKDSLSGNPPGQSEMASLLSEDSGTEDDLDKTVVAKEVRSPGEVEKAAEKETGGEVPKANSGQGDAKRNATFKSNMSRLVVPGLLNAVLQKLGPKPSQTRGPTYVSAPVPAPECCVQGVPVNAKKKEVVDSKAVGKIVKNTATPKKLFQPAGSTSAGKVVMKRTHVSRAFKRKTVLNQPLALRSKTARIGSHQQVSTASALLALQKLRTSGTWVRCSLQQCGKWRKLKEMDPSEVASKWECRKNPDVEYNYCAAAEQEWRPGAGWVHNRFTVGSLVWATVQGFPAWPAMIDDDPDTGTFFWTGVKDDGEWELLPSHYHVVFFDQKAVSRAWVLDGKLTSFFGLTKDVKTKSNARLLKAVQLSEEASKQDLVTRRERHCLAARFKGHWGPVWPGWMEQQRSSVGNREERDDELVDINHQMQALHGDGESSADTSMEDETEDVEEGHLKDLLDNNEDDVEKGASQLMPKAVVDELLVGRDASRSGRGFAKLWEDGSLFTQELSQTERDQQPKGLASSEMQMGDLKGEAGTCAQKEVAGAEDVATTAMELETSFQSNVTEDETPSQELQVALGIVEAITPVKPRGTPGAPSTPLLDPGSKKAAMFSTPTLTRDAASTSLATSTPDQARKVLDKDNNLNNTTGSNAFSADGSFMDL